MSRALERNVRLYPWYAVAFRGMFWLPVFFLYFREHLPLAQVLQLEAVYYVAVVLLEVPSGYFSDTVGRRPTLLIAAVGQMAAYALFFFGGSFAVFALAQVCFATSRAFNSGTDVSFHYDALASLGRQGEFDVREAVVARNGFTTTAVAALVGGVAGAFALHWAYALSFVSALATFGIVLAFREPPSHERTLAGDGILGQMRTCVGFLREPALLWLFGFSVLMTVLNHVPYEFYQPYIELVFERASGGAGGADAAATQPVEGAASLGEFALSGTPIAAGVHTSLTLFAGAWLAAWSIRVRDRIGLAWTLLSATLLQVVIIASMGGVLHSLIVLLAVLRSCPRALMTAPLNAAIVPRVPRQQRATYLSMDSLVGRLGFSVTLVLLSGVGGGAGDWRAMSLMLLLAAGFGVSGLLVLTMTRRAVVSPSRSAAP